MVIPRTAGPTILLPLLAQIDHELDDTDWILQRLKAELSQIQHSGNLFLPLLSGDGRLMANGD